MGIFSRKAKYKKCPYCKSKNPLAARYCGACHLDFYQLDRCKNKEAKKMLRHRRFGETFEGEIVGTTKLPSDVKRSRLILFSIFLGLFGAHNFYVGKYIKAICQCVLGILFLGLSIAVTVLLEKITPTMVVFGVTTSLENVLVLVAALVGAFPIISWFYDVLAILFKKYEVPIALEIPVDIPDEEDF